MPNIERFPQPAANDNSRQFEKFVPNYDLEISTIRPLSERAGNNLLDDEMLRAVQEDRPLADPPSTPLRGARLNMYHTLYAFKAACEHPRTTQEEYTDAVTKIIEFVKTSPEELRSLYGDD